MVDLGTFPGGLASEAEAINPAGQVAGSSYAAGAFHASVWDHGAIKDLGTLGGQQASAKGSIPEDR